MKHKKGIIGAAYLALAALVIGVSVKGQFGPTIPTPTLPLSGNDEKIAYEFSDTFEVPPNDTAKLYTLDVAELDAITAQVESATGVDNLEDYYQSTGGDGSSFYYVEDQNATITIDASNGFWSMTIEDPTAPIVPENLPSDEEGIQIAKKYVQEHNLFDGDLGEPAVGHSYTGDDLTGDRQDLDVTVAFYPSIEGHEVYGLYRIMVVVGDNGVIQKVFKQASPIQSAEEVPLKSREQVISEVMEAPASFMTTAEGISDGVITECELKYYMDGVAVNGCSYAYPVYVLSGHDKAVGYSADETQDRDFSVIVDAIQR